MRHVTGMVLLIVIVVQAFSVFGQQLDDNLIAPEIAEYQKSESIDVTQGTPQIFYTLDDNFDEETTTQSPFSTLKTEPTFEEVSESTSVDFTENIKPETTIVSTLTNGVTANQVGVENEINTTVPTNLNETINLGDNIISEEKTKLPIETVEESESTTETSIEPENEINFTSKSEDSILTNIYAEVVKDIENSDTKLIEEREILKSDTDTVSSESPISTEKLYGNVDEILDESVNSSLSELKGDKTNTVTDMPSNPVQETSWWASNFNDFTSPQAQWLDLNVPATKMQDVLDEFLNDESTISPENTQNYDYSEISITENPKFL